MKNNSWSRIPNALYTFDGLSPLGKLLYCYMLQRYKFFSKESDRGYFETQEQIAKNCNASITATKEAMKKMVDLGWLVVAKKKQKGHVFNNVYEVKDVFNIYENEEKG